MTKLKIQKVKKIFKKGSNLKKKHNRGRKKKILTKLKNFNCDKTQKSNLEKNQPLKLLENFKTQIATKHKKNFNSTKL